MRKLLILTILCPLLSMCQPLSVKGKIINEASEPVAGATVTLKGSSANIQQTTANERGEFFFSATHLTDTLIISAVGYQTAYEPNSERGLITVILRRKVGVLDEAVIIAYGTTTRRLATGSVVKVTAEQISRQPVSNPLSALQGLVPGLVVAQSNGLPGATSNLLIRGTASLKQGTQPLYMVDGVPFMINTGTLSQLMPSNQSVFNTINPSDIESIEVLKDADATAIYGSQGANGVILITTKKGSREGPKFDLAFYTGFGQPTRLPALLNTQQYLAVRRQAFANDAVAPTVANAPDLLVWDSTRYTAWETQLLGRTARTTNYQGSVAGAGAGVSYLLSANYYTEATVFPGAKPATRSSVRLNLAQATPGKKFSARLSAVYAVDTKSLPFTDLTSFILLAPNAPPLLDSAGNLLWSPGIDNPLSYLKIVYQTRMATLLGDASLSYDLFKGASLRLNLGYNNTTLGEQRQTPILSQRPSASVTGSYNISSGAVNSWLAEPQFTYRAGFSGHSLEVLLGASFQERVQTANAVNGTGFTNDDLLGNIAGAATLTASNSYSQYKYAAAFSRLSYNYRRKYVVNISLRRDGSSRFGPANRFANFGAAGLAWLFSEEPVVKKVLPFLSYGKLRGSYGITGNDQVGDYQFFDAWSTSSNYQYGGVAGILPSRLFNASYQWEKSKKWEGALELGLLKDRVLLTASYYRNRSSNQLVSYKLPSQTGFTSIFLNLDAVIENSGTEFSLEATAVSSPAFSWKSSLNLSFPRNKLVSYPGLESSTDKLNFAVGRPVTLSRTFTYTGIDPVTGLYTFLDVDGDGKISSPNDLTKIVVIGPRYYGGWQNNLSLKNWQLSFLFYGIKQSGRNELSSITAAPGLLSNQPLSVLAAWQKPADGGAVQKYTALASSATTTAYTRYRSSDALVTDASFIRLRNLSLSYNLPKGLLAKYRLAGCRFYVEGQNLLTITSYRGSDPESQNLLALPPLKIGAVGVALTF